MNLVVTLPEPWVVTSVGDRLRWSRPDTGVVVEVSPLEPLPDDRKAWGEKIVYRSVPVGGFVNQTDIYTTEMTRGWAATVVTTIVGDTARQPLFAEINFVFELVYYGAVVTCRIPRGESKRYEDELRPSITEAIMDAHPDFTGGEVACVRELYAI
jgi:hypothetical protein